MEQESLIPILKPCPFCGDRPQIVQSGTFTVQCADCGAMGPPAPNMERAAGHGCPCHGDLRDGPCVAPAREWSV